MKKLLIIAFLSLANILFSQTKFHNRYGTSFMDDAKKVIQTKDKNYVIVGETDGFGSGGNAFVMKVDIGGNVLWIKDYAGINSDEITDITELPNKMLIMCGTTGSYGAGQSDGFMMKTDSLGNMLWAKAYGNIYGDFFVKVVPDETNGFYIAGNLTDTANQVGYGVIKLDSFGNVVWTNWINDASITTNGLDMIPISTGGVLLFNTEGGSYPPCVSCWKFSPSGNLIWSNKYVSNPSGSSGMGNGAILESNLGELYFNFSLANNFTVAKSVDNCLLKLDSGGNIIWYKTYGGIYTDYCKTLINTKDGGVMLCGPTNSAGNGDFDAYLLKILSNGNVQWAKAYGTAWAEQPANVVQTLDKGFIITGGTYSSGYAYDSLKIHLVKTDSLGNSSCNYVAWNPMVVNQIASTTSVLSAQNLALIENTITWGVNNRNFYNRNFCNFSGIYQLSSENLFIKSYPNPTIGQFNLVFDKIKQKTEIKIFNSLGQLILQKNISSTDKISLSISDQPSGIYFVEVNADGESYRTKVVKE